MNIFEKYQISAKSTIFFLTGAGLDAESGIKTFRDSENGLWADHSIEEVCTPEAFYRNPEKVHNFYNLRRQELKNAIPNVAHQAMVELEKNVKLHIVTQNISGLSLKAGNDENTVIEMHGSLEKCQCVKHEEHVFPCFKDLTENDLCEICGSKLRPYITFFGEIPKRMDEIHERASSSDMFVSIGTSAEVYPAAGLINLFKDMNKPCVELNLEPSRNQSLFDFSIYKPATQAVEEFKNMFFEHIS